MLKFLTNYDFNFNNLKNEEYLINLIIQLLKNNSLS
jgi:hypothetical protein